MAKKIILALLILIFILPLVSCSKPRTTGLCPWFSVVRGKKPQAKQIVLWSSLSEEDTVRQIADSFTKRTGISVKIIRVPFEELQPKFQTAASVREGPDLITGPHDWVGPWATAKIISSVKLTQKDLKNFLPVSLKAMSFGGELYGLPISIETIGLIYNKKLVKKPPKTFAELIKISQRLNSKEISGFLYDANDFYFSFPFFGGYGGYIFKETKNGLDYNDLGLNNAGSVKACELILDFQKKYKLIPRGIGKDTAKDIAQGRFIAGKLAFIITGPWSIADYKKPGIDIDYAFTRIPKLENGKYPTPLVGVLGIMLNKYSKNKEQALQFMQELAGKESQVQIYIMGGRVPSRLDAQKDKRLAKDPDIKAIGEQAEVGIPMPNIPQLTAVWQPMIDALQLITLEKLTPKEALDSACDRIKKDIKIMME